MVNVALLKRPINQLKPVRKSRQQVLGAYCSNMYIYCALVPAVLDYDTSSCVPKIHHKQEYTRDRFQLVTEIRRAPEIKPHQAMVLSFMFFVTILKAFASLGILNMFILGKSMKLESDCCCSAL